MTRTRDLVAAASVLLLTAGLVTVVHFTAPLTTSHYVPNSAPPLLDGDQVELTAISEEGLKEPGALDPVPGDGYDAHDAHEHDPSAAPSSSAEPPPASSAADLVALTAALPVDAELPYVVGITWDGSDELVVDARYLTDEGWDVWQAIGTDAGGDERETAGTEPFIVTDVYAIQVRASSESEVPDALTVTMFSSTAEEVVVPLNQQALAGGGGREPGFTVGGFDYAALPIPEAPLAALVENPMPQIHLRSEWNPRSPSGEFDLGTVQGAAVHHTAGSNNYDRSDVPKILRAIQRYHMDGRGWWDIGYNFLIDRFGRIWEGRGGGITNTFKGVHSHSFNGLVTGVSLMGNYQGHTPSKASRDSLVEFLAWKLTLHGVSADGRILHPSGSNHPAILGHRDVPEAATACPGSKLYGRLSNLRARVIERQGLPELALELDANGDGLQDFVHVDGDTAVVYSVGYGPSAASSPFAGSEPYRTAVGQYDQFAAGPPLDGSAGAEVLARRANDGVVFRLGERAKANPRTGVPTNLVAPAGSALASPGDVTGDGDGDVVLIKLATGVVAVHPGDGSGVLGTPSSVDLGLGALVAADAPGDVNGDGDADLAVINDDGDLIYLLGDGSGGFAASATEVEGLGAYSELAHPGDVTGDGFDDAIARRGNGTVVTIVGGPHGVTGELITWDAGGAGWQRPMGVAGWGGDPARTLIAVATDGQLLVRPTPGSTALRYSPSGIALQQTSLASAGFMGDLNGDSLADIFTLTSGGTLRLYYSSPTGFGDRVTVAYPANGFWDDWDDLVSIGAAGDYNFDGTPDIVGTDADGDIMIYPIDPNDHRVTTNERRVAYRLGLYDVVGVGSWVPDGVTDIMAYGPAGPMYVLEGKGLTGARKHKQSGVSLPAGAVISPLGTLPGLQGAAVAVYNPATGEFTAYGWTSGGDWVPLPQITFTD